ncbi:MAG: glutamate 5-kinase [Methanophagales archaeon]|nr:glutamate 5-kinase [Methanophagales archaeon]
MGKMIVVRDFSEVKRIVIKVGTSNLTDKNYRLDPQKVEKLAKEIIDLKKEGREIILVTSGAIGAGIGKLDLKQRPRDIKVLQATAAVGQNILMSTYDRYFAKYEQTIAQLLLTHEDFFDRKRYLNLRNTLITLLKSGVIPIINENDTVVVDEIKLGDNDNLSALVASNLDADLLIILTDIDGLYTYDPKRSKKAEFISIVEEITPEIERIASARGKTGTGGMKTKIQAAKVTMKAGIPMVIVNGNEENILARIIAGERIGTIFLPMAGAKEKMNDRKHWLQFASSVKGKIKVDEGAKSALIKNGGSLLASGIVDVEDDFMTGDPVSIVDTEGEEFAKGISNFSSEEIKKIKGAQSKEIEQILGRKEYGEVIYRGNLVLV